MTKRIDTVSVVIPCFNAAEFIDEAVASVLSQTHAVEEIFCVDDGSTDDTLTALHRLRSESPIPLHVLSGPNGGPSVARNRGLERASGNWIQFLDADDLLAPDKLRHQLALVGSADAVPGFIAAAFRSINMDTGYEWTSSVASDPWLGLLTAKLGITSSNLWRADAVRSVGGWRTGMHTSEDPDLMYRLLQSGVSVLRDPDYFTTLRRREDSQWNRDMRTSYRGWFTFRKEVVDYMRQAGLLTPVHAAEFGQTVWSTLRQLSHRDLDFAVEMHSLVSESAMPVNMTNESWSTTQLYTLFGFGKAERIRRTLARTIPKASARLGRKRAASSK